ncbi:MAG: DNA polymerase IV [Cyclobacteriaceae bacterium]
MNRKNIEEPQEGNDNQTIIHMDLDAFFVSVECLINSKLKGIPLIVGGSNKRGVVASCSYEARKFGVHSAMPTRMALQLCPDAKIISGDMEAYSKYSRLITDIIREEVPVFEKSSIDEFYIDASGLDRYFGTVQWSKELRKKIMHESGLPISMGIYVNKMLSKVVTGEYKPNGEKHLPHKEVRGFLDPLSVRKIPMVGQKTTEFLAEMGVSKIQVLRQMPIRMLEQAFGKNGKMLWYKANGIDKTPVVPYSERKSISTECTFGQDTTDVSRLKTILIAMVEKLTFKLREDQKLTSCVTVKIRYSNFDTETKQVHIPYTASDQTLIDNVLTLFKKLYSRRMLLRLVGVRFSGLVHGNYQINLFDDTEESIKLYQALDKIKMKYGQESIIRAATHGVNKRVRMDNNVFSGEV